MTCTAYPYSDKRHGEPRPCRDSASDSLFSQFAHRLTQPGYCKFTKQPVLYAVKPDRVINAAEILVRSFKKNLVNSVNNLLGREPQVLIAPRIFSSDDAPKDISSLYLPSNLKARVKNLSKSGNMFKFYAAL